MGTSRSLSVGVVLFNTDQADFERMIHFISISASNARNIKRIKLFVKWNSRKTFSTKSVIDMLMPDLELFESINTVNVGFGVAHNLLIEQSFSDDFDFYLCINPDGFLHPNALENLVSFMDGRENIGLVEAIQFPREHPKPFDPFTGATDWCSGACLLIPRDTYALIGGFDPNIFMYCEDTDLSWRVRAEGLECFICPSAVFFHDTNHNHSAQTRRIMYESARYVANKWHADDFRRKIEELLLLENHYSDVTRLPQIKASSYHPSHSLVNEWGHMLSFSVPRWQ